MCVSTEGAQGALGFQRLLKKTHNSLVLQLFSCDGSYSPGVVTALQLLRSHGIGADTVGKLLSDILECVVGKRGKGGNISKNKVKQADAYSGVSTWTRALRKLRKLKEDELTENGIQVQMAMDASSGSQQQAGLKYHQK